MSISRRPDGRWRARYRDPSGKEHSKHFARKMDAQRWVAANAASRDRGDWVDPNRSRVTISDIGPTWLASKHLKPTSMRSYESLWRTRVQPTWGHVRLTDITYGRVVAWVAQLLNDGLSASRTKQSLLVLKQILDLAVLDGRLARNVASNVKAPPTSPSKQRYLTHRQVDQLSKQCGLRHDNNRALTLLLAYTGLRWGEARALRVKHFDKTSGTLQILDNIPAGFDEKDTVRPKSNRVRVVPLPSFVRHDLKALCRGREPESFIFTAPKGGSLNLSNFRRDVFDPAVEELGLSPLTPHDLRHTAASLAISAGASVVAVQRMLGHATPAITLSVYTHLFPADLQQVADRLDKAARKARRRAKKRSTKPRRKRVKAIR